MYFFSRKLFFFDHHAIQGENPKVSKRPGFRLSARISDFENVLLMVHVVGYMLAPQAHGTQLFFFQRPILTFLGRLSTHLSISSSPELF